MPPQPPLPKVLVTASSGWSHLTNVMANRAPRNLAVSQKSRHGIRQLINRGRR